MRSWSWEPLLWTWGALHSLYSLEILVVWVYLKSLSEIANVQRPQPTTPLRTTGSTRRRDDRHSKVGSPAGKDCVRNRARSNSACSAENTYQRILERAPAIGRQK